MFNYSATILRLDLRLTIKDSFLYTFSLFILFITFTSTYAATFTVNTTSDQPDVNPGDGICDDGSGKCSLQAAIVEANINPGADVIEFNIPGGGVHIIQPIGLGFPIISSTIKIDATTQPGYSFGNPLIVIDGTFISPGGVGLEIQGNNCEIRGLVIGNLAESAGVGGIGIHILGGQNNIIAENFIGIAADGTTSMSNFSNITIDNSGINNTIGGTNSNDRNIISGARDTGIFIDQADNNTVAGNYIGTDKDGNVSVPNFFAVVIAGSSQNNIGGSTSAHRNVISGNTVGAIDIINSTNSNIHNNFIGVNAAGTTALPNDYAIYLQAFSGNSNIIGGVGTGNLIAGNRFMGIDLQGNTNFIAGNYIGVLLDSTTAMPNGRVGIQILGGENNQIGGGTSGMGNIIANHSGEGIRVSTGGGNGQGNHITRNSIFGNDDLGIDIGYSLMSTRGETINDLEDTDSGPNNLQNYADIKSTMVDVNTNTIDIIYDVSSLPSSSSYPLTVEFFLEDGNGQGKTYIGDDTFTAADFNLSAKSITITPPAGVILTAQTTLVNTVTDADFNTSEFGTTNSIFAIPVDLFGKLTPQGVLLDWTTLPNLDEIYTLERASENRGFTQITQTSAKTETNPTVTYSHLDPQPVPGANRYRVQSLDNNGETAYSNVVEIWFNPLHQVYIYPNPLKAGSRLYLQNLPKKPLRIDLRDLNGRLIKQWQTSSGNTKQLTFDLSNIPSGVYMLNLDLESSFGHKVKVVVE